MSGNGRSQRKGILFLFSLLFLCLSLKAGKEIPICTNGADQGHPAIWGDKIVWMDYRNGSWDIYAYDLSEGKEIPICTRPGDQSDPAIFQDRIVYVEIQSGNSDIYMYDLTKKEEIRITNTTDASELYPAIYADKVVWVVLGTYDIYIYDIATKQAKVIGNTHGDPGRAPSIYGDKVVWMDWRYGDPDISKNPTIFMYDLSKQQEIQLTYSLDQWSPAIFEDKVVWIDSK
ncbi:hypothetical protein H5T87_04640 [bacterium]|nr:hypothetical protein [bacterium]